jgi:hypothetical protein
MKFKFKKFQLEDLSRAAMHDGAVVAWEPGLGKSVAAFAWPLVKGAKRILIVAPGGLHQQLRESAQEHFGIHITSLRSHGDARSFRLNLPPRPGEKPRFFVTSYTALGFNDGDEWLDGEVGDDGEVIVREPCEQKFRRRIADLGDLVIALQAAAKLTGEPSEVKPLVEPYFVGIGEVRHGIRCIWRPTMARMLAGWERCGGGFDCVVVDEGTKLQANDSHVSQGVRALSPKYRLVLTGTPIKNRLESIFWLAWWACGGAERATARWPYAGTTEAKEAFANQHLQHDRFVTREQESEHKAWVREGKKKKRKISRRSARLCNVHRLWKLLAPVVIRRRKEDCGEDIPIKAVHPVFIAPGKAQLAVYKYHLENPPNTKPDGSPIKDQRAVIGMQVNILRQAALHPNSENLAETRNSTLGTKRSWTPWTPKLAAVLSLVADCLDDGEQVMIGSPFRAFSRAAYGFLREAGVSAVMLDGETDATTRGQLAARFKKKEFSVMVAGINAMGEGHSFESCSRLILPSLSWAFDENEQFTHRVWRINSPKQVRIYPVVTKGTVDERLTELFAEKGDSAALALDGRLFDDKVEEVNLDKLLGDAIRAFDHDAETICETSIEAKWAHSLKPRLGQSEERFREHHPYIVPARNGTVTSRSEMAAALAAVELESPTNLTIEIARSRARRGAKAVDFAAAAKLAKRWLK